eukprot:5351345-Pleurochrysis_carterae.AAC.2
MSTFRACARSPFCPDRSNSVMPAERAFGRAVGRECCLWTKQKEGNCNVDSFARAASFWSCVKHVWLIARRRAYKHAALLVCLPSMVSLPCFALPNNCKRLLADVWPLSGRCPFTACFACSSSD